LEARKFGKRGDKEGKDDSKGIIKGKNLGRREENPDEHFTKGELQMFQFLARFMSYPQFAYLT